MQPLIEVTVRRPWHWSVVVLGDPRAEVPTPLRGQAIAVGDGVIAIGVRHAQDVDTEQLEGDWSWATAAIHLRSLVEAEPVQRHVLCDVVFATPQETVAVGDADGMVVLPAPGLRTRFVVSTDVVDLTGLDQVWVDLIAADV